MNKSIERKHNRTIYSVVIGIGGYMPDTGHYFTNKSDAGDFALSEARDYRHDDYKVVGNKQDGYIMTPTDTDHPLDSYIEINAIRVGELGLSESDLDQPLSAIIEQLNTSF